MQHSRSESSESVLDASRLAHEFPQLLGVQNPVAYLDSAATTQTPRSVAEAMLAYQMSVHGNVQRGAHTAGELSTRMYEDARRGVASFVDAPQAEQVVLVGGATEGFNLLAECLSRGWRSGHRVLVGQGEHHSNWLPWQRACVRRGASFEVIPVTPSGAVDTDWLAAHIDARVAVVAVSQLSNVTGALTNIPDVARICRRAGAWLVVDGAQAVGRMPVSFQQLGCDFYCFSGHKMYGPTGIGAVVGRSDAWQELPPYRLGGGMVRSVGLDVPVFASAPSRFEAGTPNVVGAVGLRAAITLLSELGPHAVYRHEGRLTRLCRQLLSERSDVRILGGPYCEPGKQGSDPCLGLVSFVLQGVHAHDVSTILDAQGVAVRAGHHCAQPLMAQLGVTATVRASFGVYNTEADLQRLMLGLEEASSLFRRD